MTKKSRIKEIKEEIEWYQPPKRISDAMLKLGKDGFEFSGHGCGMVGEDFNLIKKDTSVNFCLMGRKAVVSIQNAEYDTVFEGTIGESFKYLASTE